MFHFQPTLVSSDIGYSRPQLPRSRYISSLADIRAAEVAECEERDLLRRLEEIQLQKQQDRFIRSRPQSLYSDSYSPYYANAFEDEELELAARRRQERLQLEYLRRKAEEEARLLALKRSEEELKLKQLALLREEEESRLHSLRREVEQLEAKKRQKALVVPKFVTQVNGGHSYQAKQRESESRTAAPCRHPAPEAQMLEQLLSNFVTHLPKGKPEHKPFKEKAEKQDSTLAASSQSLPSPQTLEQALRLLFNPQPHVSTPSPEANMASSSQSRDEANTKPLVENEETRSYEARPISPLSLKQQLEARLNNDKSIEIQDTIHALLASLSDSPAPSSHAATPAYASDNKGKEKAPETPLNLESSTSSSNTPDVLESIGNIEASFTVLQDEFEFPSEVDFSPAPSRSSSPARDDSVQYASDSDTSTIRKLAFTARNHPIRSYEQSLTRLLAKLDEIESNGNPEVRVRRKSVVGLVEGALEELERKVETRWNKWNKSRRVERQEETSENVEGNVTVSYPRDADAVESKVSVEDVAKVSGLAREAVDEAGSDSSLAAHDCSETQIDSNTRPSYAEVVERQPESSFDVETYSAPDITGDSNSAPSDGLVEHVEVSPSPGHVSEAASAPSTGDNAAETEGSPDSNPSRIISSYPPVSTTSSVATIRPLVSESNSDDPASPATEDHLEQGEESEVEVVDTFLLPDNQSSDLDVGSKRDSEDVGSDWSEVEA